MTSRERQILALIREDPLLSQAAIAEKLGISRSAVAGHIMKLGAKGIIRGRGYVISDTPFTVVIGGANIDICGAPTGDLYMRDSNPGTVDVSPGGVARNIAENLARLGVQCRLITAVGTDYHGDLLCEQGQATGIDMGYVLRVDAQPTSTYVSVLDDTGDMLVAINDMSIVDEIRPERLRRHAPMLKRARLIVADTNLSTEPLGYISQTSVGKSPASFTNVVFHGSLLRSATTASSIATARSRAWRKRVRLHSTLPIPAVPEMLSSQASPMPGWKTGR